VVADKIAFSAQRRSVEGKMGNGRSGGWPEIAIELTEQERSELTGLSRWWVAPHREVIRAKALLAAAAGKRNRAIATLVGVTDRTVYNWRDDFRERRLKFLRDRPRSGRPRRFSPLRAGSRGSHRLHEAGR
jgi:hypothetical protein